MPVQNRPGNSSEDDIIGVVVVGVLIVVGFFALVYFLRPVWLWYSTVEAYLSFYTSFSHSSKVAAANFLHWASTHTGDDVNQAVFNAVRKEVLSNGIYRYILTGVSLAMLWLAYDRRRLYHGAPSINSLLSTEYRVWPTLRFVKAFNPLTAWNELKGEGRYADSPFAFAAKNDLIVNLSSKSKSTRRLDRQRSSEVFAEQLGKRFTSFNDLTGFEAVVVTLIACREVGISWDKGYRTLLDDLTKIMCKVKVSPTTLSKELHSVCMPVLIRLDDLEAKTSKSSIPLINTIADTLVSNHQSVLKKRSQSSACLDQSAREFFSNRASRHAYTYTLLTSLIRDTKRNGKFPSGRLVALRYWDRPLFMLIATNPFYVPYERKPEEFVNGMFVEAGGVIAHYQCELYAGRALVAPHVVTAVDALEFKLILQNVIAESSATEDE